MLSGSSSESKDQPRQTELVFSERSLGSELSFPTDLSGMKVLKHHPGGSGGVYEVELGKRRFMLKLATTEEHLKREVLADTLYLRMGAKVPGFALYRGLPEELEKQLGLKGEKASLFRLSEKIEGEKPTETETITDEMKKHFVLDAYLRNRDITRPENLIRTPKGEVYRIDNGSILSVRAQGKENVEDIEHVIEIETMRDEKFSLQGSRVYSGLSPDEIKAQKEEIIKNSNLIIGTALELNKKLKFDFFEPVYSQLVYRLQSLAYDKFSDNSSPFSEYKKRVEQNADYCAAGVLSYCHVKGKYYLLLGNRTGTHENHWCNLGGGYEARDKKLYVTAAREVHEESNGLISHDAEGIAYHPFFDTPINSHGIKLYRMYISPTPYQRVDELNDQLKYAEGHHKEYSEFRWISLDSLKNNFKDGPFQVEVLRDNGKVEKEEIQLYPDMVKLLHHNKVLENFPILPEKPPHLPAHQAHIKTVLANRMFSQADLVLELKRKFPDKNEAKEEATSRPSTPLPSLSEIHLDLILDNPQNNSLEEKIDRFTKEAAIGAGSSIYDEGFKSTMVEAIKKEKEYQAKGYCSVYHSAPRKIVILYDLYTELYKHLNHLPEETYLRFRLSETPFKKMPTLIEFMNHFSKDDSKSIDNYAEDYQQMGLSVNLFAFGSHQQQNSATYFLFLTDKAGRDMLPFSKDSDIDKGLAELGLDESMRILMRNRLNTIWESEINLGGRLHQINLPIEIVDDYLYPAESGGRELIIGGEKIKFSKLIEMIRNKKIPESTVATLQGRLFLHPEQAKEAKTFTFELSTTKQKKEYQKTIRKQARILYTTLLNQGTIDWISLKKTKSDSSGEISSSSRTTAIFKSKLEELTGDVSNPNPTLILKKIIETGEFTKLKYFNKQFPAYFSEEINQVTDDDIEPVAGILSCLRELGIYNDSNLEKVLKKLKDAKHILLLFSKLKKTTLYNTTNCEHILDVSDHAKDILDAFAFSEKAGFVSDHLCQIILDRASQAKIITENLAEVLKLIDKYPSIKFEVREELLKNAGDAKNINEAFSLLSGAKILKNKYCRYCLRAQSLAVSVAKAFIALNNAGILNNDDNIRDVLTNPSMAEVNANIFVLLDKAKIVNPEIRKSILNNSKYNFAIFRVLTLLKSEFLEEKICLDILKKTQYLDRIEKAYIALDKAGILEKTYQDVLTDPKQAEDLAEGFIILDKAKFLDVDDHIRPLILENATNAKFYAEKIVKIFNLLIRAGIDDKYREEILKNIKEIMYIDLALIELDKAGILDPDTLKAVTGAICAMDPNQMNLVRALSDLRAQGILIIKTCLGVAKYPEYIAYISRAFILMNQKGILNDQNRQTLMSAAEYANDVIKSQEKAYEYKSRKYVNFIFSALEMLSDAGILTDPFCQGILSAPSYAMDIAKRLIELKKSGPLDDQQCHTFLTNMICKERLMRMEATIIPLLEANLDTTPEIKLSTFTLFNSSRTTKQEFRENSTKIIDLIKVAKEEKSEHSYLDAFKVVEEILQSKRDAYPEYNNLLEIYFNKPPSVEMKNVGSISSHSRDL